jgi:pimeloyl-ACP methyl ester carboxylesterase
MRVVAPIFPAAAQRLAASGAHYDNDVYSRRWRLIARLGVPRVDWVGTSLGGYIGMAMAALPHNPIRRLVLNDFGARVGHTALRRIATYLRVAPKFRDVAAAEVYLREVLAPFGALTDAQWQHMARHSLVKGDKGWRWHYDPAIANNFSLLISFDVVLWHLWDEIACPTLIMRGEDSDLLAQRTVNEMLQRGHAAVAGDVAWSSGQRCGHAPSLMADDQIVWVWDFCCGRRMKRPPGSRRSHPPGGGVSVPFGRPGRALK